MIVVSRLLRSVMVRSELQSVTYCNNVINRSKVIIIQGLTWEFATRLYFTVDLGVNPKRAGGGRNPSTFFCYISAGCYFFALKLHDFFSSSLALNLRPFLKKNQTGGYDAALRNRALGPTKN